MRRRRPRWLLGRHPSAWLLVTQLTGMVVYPFIENTPWGLAGLGVFGTLVLIVTTLMVRRTPWLTGVSVLIALPAVLLVAAQAVWHLPQLRPYSATLEAVFYFYAAGSLIAYMMADRRVSTDELFAAGATFTLLAWGFAYLFVALQSVYPGSFAAAVDSAAPRRWTELVYLSFALLSSTGIGDVIPITPPARALASLEMFVGVMYLAAVVARLIGMTLIAQVRDQADQSAQERIEQQQEQPAPTPLHAQTPLQARSPGDVAPP